MADLSTEQPMPTPNDSPSVQGMVRADLEVRERIGIQRYGTALQPHNGRDALRDAYEEALDLACYLRQAIAEREESFIARVDARHHNAAAAAVAADSCTCVYRPNGGPDPACPVHHGRRARGPKPPPLGPGCICDGSGRTCPRHGVVI